MRDESTQKIGPLSQLEAEKIMFSLNRMEGRT